MARLVFVSFLCVLTHHAIAAVSGTASSSRDCTMFDLQIPATVEVSIYDIPRVDSNIDAIDFVWELQRWTAPNITDRIKGAETVHDTFTINAQLCTPKHSKGSTLHIATHGPWFDKTYWDLAIEPENYSYVDAALDVGYSVLTYDRLGVGKSSKPDAYKAVQAAVQIEILKEIILRARSQVSFRTYSTYATSKEINIPAFDNIVLVGHSFGSGILMGVLAQYGDIVEAVVATGLLVRGRVGGIGYVSFGLEHAESNDKERFRGRGSGYMVQGSESSVNQVFFKKGFFNPRMLDYAVGIKETVTVGEFMSLGAVLQGEIPRYSGPILFVLGENDLTSCVGNCIAAYDLDAMRGAFSGASDVSVYIQKGSGHALTMHEDAKDHYNAIFDYLHKEGL